MNATFAAVAPVAGATLNEWLGYLERIHRMPIELGLDRVREVYQRLKLRNRGPVFTVGGTNGKGSTCALLEAILSAEGYRVGCYTSPHLLRYNERVRVAGQDLDDAALIASMEAVERARGEVSLSYFEFGTLAALVAFEHAAVDAMILEVGLGGRLDAVNVVDPDVAAVVTVGLDHQDYLGPDRESIGREKAGIFRHGVPAICGDDCPPISIGIAAEALGAKLACIGRDFGFRSGLLQWHYWAADGRRRSSLPYPALRGRNQLSNASTVLAMLDAMSDRLPVSMQAIRTGLTQVKLPGRFQVLPGQPAVVLDVAHNVPAASVLAQNLRSMGRFPITHGVIALLADKDAVGITGALGATIQRWHVASTAGPRGLPAQNLALALAAEGRWVSGEYADPAAAYDRAREQAGANDRIVVFGSFLTVAAVMRHIQG